MNSNDFVMGILGLAVGLLFFIFIIFLVSYILEVVGLWKMFKKADQPGWASLIPIYKTYILYKIIGVNPYWLLISIVAGMFGSMIPIIGQLLVMAVTIYVGILTAISTANSFGKDTGFGIVAFFFAPICHLILGCGNAEYLGPKPMQDFIFKNDEATINNSSNSTNNANGTGKFCTNCGAALTKDSNFCPYCGNESK